MLKLKINKMSTRVIDVKKRSVDVQVRKILGRYFSTSQIEIMLTKKSECDGQTKIFQ
jgi:hypothetical protein